MLQKSTRYRPLLLLGVLLAVTAPPLRGSGEGAVATPEPGFVSLFDGSQESFAAWWVIGPDNFVLVDGTIQTRPGGDDLALLYYAPQPFEDFVLRLQFRIADPADNSGVHVRFRDPTLPVPEAVLAAAGADLGFPNREAYAGNGAWLAVDSGFEVQIDDTSGRLPDDPSDAGLDEKRTGAFYDIPIGEGAGRQRFQRGPTLAPGQWYDLEIDVRGQDYVARVNGKQTAALRSFDPLRGLPPSVEPTSGYIGIQAIWFNAGHVDFRHIRIRELPASPPPGTTVP